MVLLDLLLVQLSAHCTSGLSSDSWHRHVVSHLIMQNSSCASSTSFVAVKLSDFAVMQFNHVQKHQILQQQHTFYYMHAEICMKRSAWTEAQKQCLHKGTHNTAQSLLTVTLICCAMLCTHMHRQLFIHQSNKMKHNPSGCHDL